MAGKVNMGYRSYSNGAPITRGDISDLHIGKFCCIAQNVVFDLGFHHETEFVTTYPLNVMFNQLKHITGHPKSKGDITIGSDVWIGEGSIIMGGITIGHGAVIAAGAVVTKDVEPYEIVGGVPAKAIKKRFNHFQVVDLLKISWWDWSDAKIVENAELLMGKDIQKFIDKHKHD
jgi:acetyltransferase-like isoleucine patch superfamily enzyme